MAHFNRKWSQEVNLIKGFRYKLTFLYYGNGHNPEFLRLGVRFPDGSEEKPISSKYLWRSMGMSISMLDTLNIRQNPGSSFFFLF